MSAIVLKNVVEILVFYHEVKFLQVPETKKDKKKRGKKCEKINNFHAILFSLTRPMLHTHT